MNDLYTVTICIPAYNEQHNMDNILMQIFRQNQKGFVIKKIIVASDGSTDNTVKIAKKYINRGVEVIEGQINRGQTYRQNEMIEKASSDILVLLNADLVLADTEVLSRLILKIINGADLSAQWARPLPARTFIERILTAGFKLKLYAYLHFKNGNNIYTCVGHIRALSKKFYSTVKFPTVSEGEDQYLYLLCKSKGFTYRYNHAKNLFFKLPDNYTDYKNYAKRIFQTQIKYTDIFSEKLVNTERKIPLSLILRSAMHSFVKNPVYTIFYIILHMYMQRWSLRQPMNVSHTFKISKSTKVLSG